VKTPLLIVKNTATTPQKHAPRPVKTTFIAAHSTPAKAVFPSGRHRPGSAQTLKSRAFPGTMET